MSAERLYKLASAPKSKSNSYKYKLNCQEKITKDTPSTDEWLELLKYIDHQSDSVKIFEAMLNKTKTIIVKVGLGTNIVHEYNIWSNTLSKLNLPTFISFYCYFSCLDSFKNIPLQKGLCGSGSDDVISVIAMPFIHLGRIDKTKWTRENIDSYKSVLKHVVCTILYAFETFMFTHNDMHFGNILLKKTKKKEIVYGEHMTLPIVNGYIPVIMDFERSQTQSPVLNVFEDIGKLFNLAGTEIDVKLNISKAFVSKYIIMKQRISRHVYAELCEYIDTRRVIYVSSEMGNQFSF